MLNQLWDFTGKLGHLYQQITWPCRNERGNPMQSSQITVYFCHKILFSSFSIPLCMTTCQGSMGWCFCSLSLSVSTVKVIAQRQERQNIGNRKYLYSWSVIWTSLHSYIHTHANASTSKWRSPPYLHINISHSLPIFFSHRPRIFSIAPTSTAELELY